MSNDINEDLKNSAGDYIHTAAKGILSSIPLVGGAVTELFNLVISPPLEKRRDEWLIRLSDAIEEIRQSNINFNYENLANNELFISIVMQTTQLALRNHQAEKLLALRNAVINTALNISIQEEEQLSFIRLVDDLSVWQLKILHYFQNPNKWFEDNNKQKPNIFMGSPVHALTTAFQELSGQDAFINRTIRELYNMGLFSGDSIGAMMTEQGIYASRTTEYANRFIRYISYPDGL